MGQASSAPRGITPQPQTRRFSQPTPERTERNARESRISRRISRREGGEQMPPTRRDGRQESNATPYGTFRRQVSAQSVTVQPDASRPGDNIGRDEVVYEQEERPLVNMEDLRMRDGPITHIAAPLLRRPSALSRLCSRLLPNSIMSGLLNSGEESAAEGRALRRGITTPPSPESLSPVRRRSRHLDSLRLTRGDSSSVARRQSIRGPFPYHGNSARLPDSPTNSSSLDRVTSTLGQSETNIPTRRRSRLGRMRNSLGSFSQYFGRPSELMESTQAPRTPPRRPSRVGFAEDSDYLLPPLVNMGNHHEADEGPHELDPTEAEGGRTSLSPTPSTGALQAANGIRRLPNVLRARSSRLMRRDDNHVPLSRVLQLAAAAIAAQLSGIPGPAMPNVRAVGEGGVDGSLEEFVQTLQHATTQPSPGNAEDRGGSASNDGSLPPVNFLRVFRFANNNETSNSSGATNRSGLNVPEERTETEGEGSDGRTMTLVVVGVRSVPSNNTGAEDAGTALGPSLDTLLSLPIIPSTSNLRNHGSGSFMRRPDGRSRFSPRRNSMGGINTSAFPAAYDNQRHQRVQAPHRGQSDNTINGSSLPTVLSESPPGPHPPPSTPAEPGLSAYSSGTTTPNRRPSSASAIPPPNLPNLRETPLPRTDLETTAEETSFNIARQRRRSDSEFARHRELGSGAARRNGVVGPDNPPTQGGRSWLIYVVGTNLSEDHPAFATPSLFTDHPTYEDMLLLSSLLGPSKPPVATQADVTSAGGIYRLIDNGGLLMAEPLGTAPRILLNAGERCLICLCDYDASEEVRQLAKCRHMYHRECIDVWLTTGRNSCPLCREQGVGESSSSQQQA